MKEKIQQIQNYFLAKIEAKEFEVTEVKFEEVNILIDNEFEFKFAVYSMLICQFTGVVKLESDFKVIQEIYNEHQEAHKLAQYEKLKLELGL